MIDPPAPPEAPPRRSLVALLVLLPVAVQALIVTTFGANMLVYDELHYAAAFREIGEGRPWSAGIAFNAFSYGLLK